MSGNSVTTFCQSQAFLSLCSFTTSSLQLAFAKNYIVLSHFSAVLFWETFLLRDWYLFFRKK